MYHEKYQHASNLGDHVPDVHLPLKPGGEHQQSLNNHFPWKGGSVSSTIIISLLATTRINQNAVVSCLYIGFKIDWLREKGLPGDEDLQEDVDEEQLHHHDEQGPLRHWDQQVVGFYSV